MRRHQLVFVRWRDAAFQAHESRRREFTRNLEVQTAGLLVRDDKKSCSIALDWYPADRTYRRIEHIPKKYIIEIRRGKMKV